MNLTRSGFKGSLECSESFSPYLETFFPYSFTKRMKRDL